MKPSEATGLKLMAVRNLCRKRKKRSHGEEVTSNQSVTGILGPFSGKLLQMGRSVLPIRR